MHPHFPLWLHALSIASLVLAVLCAGWIARDVRRRPPHMAIMALVWPLCALFGSVLWVWLYRRFGRATPDGHSHEVHHDESDHDDLDTDDKTPMWASVAKAASHCGAGCALGDLIAEWAAFAFPAIAVAMGWHTLFAEKTFAVWGLDFLVAFGLGIAFQYFTIKPMGDLSPGRALVKAVKADTASITAWQVGMYGFMALAQFAVLRPGFGDIAPVASPEFWFVMQGAMLCGFVTAFPVNWWLIHAGVKERM
ncbi:DUF4396 domain-containing protein [Novosphingobium profundi]|uniref:DUF4396 domain-containing protein n=1 Tax=Novosphingobium profundi TaxID=1774954 RepID=UPI001BD9452F|nr:DUF4396 domain-containing protein [Novosphingobium profundi]MBT0670596.1 DUF4396 domain-containing protein [Novosphingobium profundi]